MDIFQESASEGHQSWQCCWNGTAQESLPCWFVSGVYLAMCFPYKHLGLSCRFEPEQTLTAEVVYKISPYLLSSP